MELSIKKVLIERDGISAKEADDLIMDCKKQLSERLRDGESAENICQEFFGLEPDYIFEILEL